MCNLRFFDSFKFSDFKFVSYIDISNRWLERVMIQLGLAPLDPEVLREALRQRSVASKSKIRRRTKNRHRNRGFMLNEMEVISELEFKKMFRMSRSSFTYLLSEIDSKTNHTESEESIRNAVNSSGSALSKKAKLGKLMFKAKLGTFGIAIGSFFHEYGPLWNTITAIDETFCIGIPFTDKCKLDAIAVFQANDRLCFGNRRLGVKNQKNLMTMKLRMS